MIEVTAAMLLLVMLMLLILILLMLHCNELDYKLATRFK